MNSNFSFPEVTLLITHYNRSGSLQRLLDTFEQFGCHFGEIIVSDDASNSEHLKRLRDLQLRYNFRLITTPENKGHGHSINKGQDAVKTPYTLYVQEDFVPLEKFPPRLADSLQFMKEDKTIDYVRYWALAQSYPRLKSYGKGFSEMIYSPWDTNHLKFYQYSDTVHLRRSNFFGKFGRYKEGLKGDEIDYKMAVSFLQHKGKGLFYDEFNTLFEHQNSEDEPSTMRPYINWRQKKNIITVPLRWLYLKYKWLKCTLDVKFMRL